MTPQKVSFFIFSGILGSFLTACGASSTKKTEPVTSSPLSTPIALNLSQNLAAGDFDFGPAWLMGSYVFDAPNTTHQIAFKVHNRGRQIHCFARLILEPEGETNPVLSKQSDYLDGQLMTNESDFVYPCLKPNETAYVLSYVDSSASELKALNLLGMESREYEGLRDFQQVSVMSQTMTDSKVQFVLKNTSDRSIRASSFSKWFLKSGEQILDWGFLNSSESQSAVEPQQTFTVSGLHFLEDWPVDTRLEFLADDFEVL